MSQLPLWSSEVIRPDETPFDSTRDLLAEYGERPNAEAASDEVES